ncbi:MAG: SufE family protein [Kiritimatiellae bacterium]|nr:SufE family protein [Kiritimatiellia bacterium]
MSSLEEKKLALLDELNLFSDVYERLDYLIDEARDMESLPAERCVEANRIEGCLSNLWFVAEVRSGRCWFLCDADSLVVKSIAGLLCRFYSGATPTEILALDPSFLREAGITEHLSSNRRNALTRVWGRIKACAESAK